MEKITKPLLIREKSLANEHQLIELVKQIELTYPRLGRLVAMSIIAVKARQFLLVVSPSGCGKSANTFLLGQSRKDVIRFLSAFMTACFAPVYSETMVGIPASMVSKILIPNDSPLPRWMLKEHFFK